LITWEISTELLKNKIETTLITGGMDENDALKWENLPFDDVLQGLLRGLSTKEANSYADELRKVKFHLTDPVDSTKLHEWISQIVTLDSKYESYLLEIKDDEEENRALVKIQTDKFSNATASKGLKRLKQLLAGKKIDNIEELIRQVTIILRDEKKYCLAARYWGYEIPTEKAKLKHNHEQNMEENSTEVNTPTVTETLTEKPKSDKNCSACGSKKHNRDECAYLKNGDEEVNQSTTVPWKLSRAGIKCMEKYGWTQLPPTKIRPTLTAEKK